MFKIVIVEDDENIREELQLLLENDGYKVEIIHNFKNVDNQIKILNPHLILLDVNLPNENGYFICSKLRKDTNIPIIFISSKNTPMDELKGITLGGDDYIEKPYNIPVLLARISNLLSRVYPKNKEELIQYKGIQLNILSSCIEYNGKSKDLTRNELKILYYLFKNTGKIIPRIDIVEYLWDNEMYIDDNTLSVNITRIREKLNEIGIIDLIETKRGQGYKI